MGNFTFEKCGGIEGLYLIQPKVFGDNRGYFMETYNYNAFKEAGMRDDVKIIIGGNPVSEEACKALGADEWAYSPQKTVQVCANWVNAA